jgi:hypothetical protein
MKLSKSFLAGALILVVAIFAFTGCADNKGSAPKLSPSSMTVNNYPDNWGKGGVVSIKDFDKAIADKGCNYKPKAGELAWDSGAVTLAVFRPIADTEDNAYGVKVEDSRTGEELVVWSNSDAFFEIDEANQTMSASMACWLWMVMAECDTATKGLEFDAITAKVAEFWQTGIWPQ